MKGNSELLDELLPWWPALQDIAASDDVCVPYSEILTVCLLRVAFYFFHLMIDRLQIVYC